MGQSGGRRGPFISCLALVPAHQATPQGVGWRGRLRDTHGQPGCCQPALGSLGHGLPCPGVTAPEAQRAGQQRALRTAVFWDFLDLAQTREGYPSSSLLTDCQTVQPRTQNATKNGQTGPFIMKFILYKRTDCKTSPYGLIFCTVAPFSGCVRDCIDCIRDCIVDVYE